jgi:hypothetical protein
MIHFERWKRMSLVERRLYEANMRRSKKVMLVCAVIMLFLLIAGALGIYLKDFLS